MSNFKARLTTARTRAKELIGQAHVSVDVSDIVQDLLNMIMELERQLGSTDGQGADIRVLRSRLETANTELKRKDDAVTSFKKKFLDIVIAEIRNITAEVTKLQGSDQASAEPVQARTKAISASLRTMIENLSKA